MEVGESWGGGEWKGVMGNGKKADSKKWDWEPYALILIMTWGLDLKNRSGVRDLVPTPHREDAGI